MLGGQWTASDGYLVQYGWTIPFQSKTFDWKVGGVMSRAFVGVAQGRTVVVFVAKEGLYEGKVLSAIVPDLKQMSQWGLR
jgi:hypothetical protein